ncbi:MAG: hypothetical protein RL026_2224 [Pseudomonadota bacterium]|jgi:2,3-dihydroxybenzoate decarboxylase
MVTKPEYLRIATEEAFAPAYVLKMYQELAADAAYDDPGYKSLWGFYANSPSERARFIMEGLADLGDLRLAHMDAAGIDRQIIALTSPGVQCFDAATGTRLATETNDILADACRRHPDRFTGMAAVAPQDVAGAVKEMERAVRTLDMRAVILNGHTRGEYHDMPKFWPLFEAAEALGVPIYLHPNSPPKQMIEPFLEAGLDGAVYGFGVDTGLHMLRIICAGVFDRFPKLQFIIGHAGEALPFWLYRLDYMHGATIRSRRYPQMKALDHPISHYLRHNVHITNSGVAWQPAIEFCQRIIGADRVMYAMDYPYQYVPDEVGFCDAMTIPDADKKRFFQSNAERVFRLVD